jgi:hypothetical protein
MNSATPSECVRICSTTAPGSAFPRVMPLMISRRCHGLQLRCQVRRLADRNTLPCVAAPALLADNHQPRGYADARPRKHIDSGLRQAVRIEDRDRGAHRLLGVMFMRRGIAEINDQAIAQILRNKSIEPHHHIGNRFVEGTDLVAHVLRIERGPRADHIADHDRELPPLRAAGVDHLRTQCVIGALGAYVVRWLGAVDRGRFAWGLVRPRSATTNSVAASGCVFSSRLSSATRSL